MADDFQLPSELLDDGFFNAFLVDREGKHEEEKDGDMGDRSFLRGGDDKARDPLIRAAGKGAARSELDDAERRRRSHHEHWLLNLQILHLKQRQLLQQQLHAAWAEAQTKARRGASYGGGRSTSVSSPSLRNPLLLQHHPHSQSGSRAVFLSRSGARNESAGTGVFLPRTAVSEAEPADKKSSNHLVKHKLDSVIARGAAVSSTVFIPVGVFPALNLNNTSLLGGFAIRHDAFMGRADAVRLDSHLQPATIRIPMSSLPHEWNH